MTVTALYFAQVAEIIGLKNERFELVDTVTSSEFKDILLEKYPQIADQKFKFAINQVLIQNEQQLKDGDEIALLPPFAGG